MTERMEKRVRILNQAEQIRQQFLAKGLAVANTAKQKFLKGGYKAARKYAASLNN